MKDIGIDIVDVKRIERLIKNKRFLKRVFTDEEINYCGSKKNSAQHYAVRFAAKESVWKALGENVSHKDIGIRNSKNGKPAVFIKNREDKRILISLSHTKEYAVAICVIK